MVCKKGKTTLRGKQCVGWGSQVIVPSRISQAKAQSSVEEMMECRQTRSRSRAKTQGMGTWDPRLGHRT